MPDRRQGDRRQGDRRQGGDRRETPSTHNEPITLSLKSFIIILVISAIIIFAGTAFIVTSIISSREQDLVTEYIEDDIDTEVDETEDFSDDEIVNDENLDNEIVYDENM